MTPFTAIASGGLAGFSGAALAHIFTTFCDHLGGEEWLRGPYGPQFFPIALYTGIFYAALGAVAGRRATTALTGLFGPFLGIALPMAFLTHRSEWGMPRHMPATPQWQAAVIALYVLAVWGTIAVLGAMASRTARWRGALAGVAGSLCAYGVLSFILWAFPSYGQTHWNPVSYLPSPVNLLDGFLSGAGLCLALALDERLSPRAR